MRYAAQLLAAHMRRAARAASLLLPRLLARSAVTLISGARRYEDVASARSAARGAQHSAARCDARDARVHACEIADVVAAPARRRCRAMIAYCLIATAMPPPRDATSFDIAARACCLSPLCHA